MKITRFRNILVALTVGFLLTVSSAVFASEESKIGFTKQSSSSDSGYFGEFCWQYQQDEETIVFKIGVFHMGGGHFMLSGKGNDGYTQYPIRGNAEFINDEVVMYLTTLGGDPEYVLPTPEGDIVMNVVGGAFMYIRLDPQTLSGEALVLEAVAFDPEPEGYETGIRNSGIVSMTLVACD